MQRPHPAHRSVCRLRPAHRLRPGQLGQTIRQDLSQNIGRGPALAVNDRQVEFAFPVVALLALFERDARGAQKAVDGLGRRIDTRTLLLLADIGLLAAVSPLRASVSRRGPAKDFAPSNNRPRSESAPTMIRSRSRAACACMRAGISSLRSSRRRSAISQISACSRPSALRATLRSMPWPVCARAQCRRRAPSR